MALIAKGYAVSIVLEEKGGTIKAPASFAMLHDPSGKYWPACSLLVAPFERTSDDVAKDALAKSYFGDDALRGEAVLPPRKLAGWRELGFASEIRYSRRRPRGLKAAHAGDYYHPLKADRAVLYKHARFLRLDFLDGCKLNWRGIVDP